MKNFSFLGKVIHVFNDRFVKGLALFEEFVIQIGNEFFLSSRVESRRDQATQAKRERLKQYNQQ